MSHKERPKRQNPQIRRLRREIDSKFLSDFDPEKSTRERRKLTRKVAASMTTRDTVYDEYGRFRELGYSNICDCMNEQCRGCHYPCPSCGSSKCGPVCRVNRKFAFEYIEFDGKDATIKNRFLHKN